MHNKTLHTKQDHREGLTSYARGRPWIIALVVLAITLACSRAGTFADTVLPITTPSAAATVTTAPITATAAEPSPTLSACQVSATGLYLRAGPGMEYRPLTVLTKGATVTIEADLPAGHWQHVKAGSGAAGWVNSLFLDCGK